LIEGKACERKKSACHKVGKVETEIIWVEPDKIFGMRPKICQKVKRPCKFYPIHDLNSWKKMNGDIPFPTCDCMVILRFWAMRFLQFCSVS
jgi:hypothetical protein